MFIWYCYHGSWLYYIYLQHHAIRTVSVIAAVILRSVLVMLLAVLRLESYCRFRAWSYQ